MQIQNITANIREIAKRTGQGVQNLGKKTIKYLGVANQSFDSFVKNKGKDPKTIKEYGVGAAVGVIGFTLAISCIKGIVNSIKEKINEK